MRLRLITLIVLVMVAGLLLWLNVHAHNGGYQFDNGVVQTSELGRGFPLIFSFIYAEDGNNPSWWQQQSLKTRIVGMTVDFAFAIALLIVVWQISESLLRQLRVGKTSSGGKGDAQGKPKS
jgi:hypothetical protein